MRPSEYYKQGLKCGESMIKAFNEDNDTNIPVALGSGMGLGFTVGSICGAIGAATVIIGYLKGRNDINDTNEARKCTRELMNILREKYGTELCKELKQNKVSCFEIIDSTYEALEEVLK